MILFESHGLCVAGCAGIASFVLVFLCRRSVSFVVRESCTRRVLIKCGCVRGCVMTASSSSSSARCSAMRQIPNSNIPYPYCPPSVRQYPGQPGRCWVTSLEAAQAQCNADVACCGITKDAMGMCREPQEPHISCFCMQLADKTMHMLRIGMMSTI